MLSTYCKHGRLRTVRCYMCNAGLPSGAEERKRTALVAGTPVRIMGTKHNDKFGTVTEALSNGYNVQLDGGEARKFYHHQLMAFPELQTL